MVEHILLQVIYPEFTSTITLPLKKSFIQELEIFELLFYFLSVIFLGPQKAQTIDFFHS